MVTTGAAELFPADLGDGIELHATRATDAAEAFAVIDSQRVRLQQWLAWIDETTSVEIERDFLRTVEAANAAGDGLHATVRVDGRFAGLIGLRLDAGRLVGEIGYWLNAEYAGRGVMTRSATAIIDAAFGSLGLQRVQLLAATGNQRSRAIAERLGLRHEGVQREAAQLADGFVDLEVYAIVAGEWAAIDNR